MSTRKEQLDQDGYASVVIPDYVAEFACIGPACEDSCCRGWREIGVDAHSNKLYQLVRDKELRKRLQENIVSTTDSSSSSPFRILLNEDTSCPFWNKRRLCDIQESLGAEALCYTCASYPRLNTLTLGVEEYSLTFSCPEAVRKALLRPEGIRFDHRPLERRAAVAGMNALDPYLAPEHWRSVASAIQLRSLWITQLQDREVDLYSRISHCEQTLPQSTEKRLPFSQRILQQQRFLRLCVGSLGFKPCENSRYEKLRLELEPYLAVAGNRLYTWVATRRYLRAAKRFKRQLLSAEEYLFENFLVAHLFRGTLAKESQLRQQDTLVGVLLYYALLQGHLIALQQVRGTLTSADVVYVVQALAKQCEHRRQSLRDLLLLFRHESHCFSCSVSNLLC